MSTLIPEPSEWFYKEEKGIKKYLLIAIGVLGLASIAAAAYFIPSIVNDKTDSPVLSLPITREDVTVHRVAGDSVKTVPENFPTDIPVETILEESYSVRYQERNLTQFTVRYSSLESVQSKHKEYFDYMLSKGYSISRSDNKNGLASVYGSLLGNDLSVEIKKGSNGTDVYLTYVKRD